MTPSPERPLRETGESQWIFPWRRRASRLGPLFVPVCLALLGFAGVLALLRVKVGSPQFEMERLGSLVYLPPEGDGQAWAVRAWEAGPALSRYEPAGWQGYAALEREVMAATTVGLPAREPRLRDLPDEGGVSAVELAPRGQPVLPARKPPPAVAVPPRTWRMVPALIPLAPLAGAVMPDPLPPLAGEIKPEMAAIEWRFLLHLRPDGTPDECLALTKSVAGSEVLEAWLRGIPFDPKLARNGGWFALALRFHNQAEDGTDDH